MRHRTHGEPHVEIRRSRRRRRTVSAYRAEDGHIVVLLPARLSKAEEDEWVDTMVGRVCRAEEKRRPSDRALAKRAEQLSAKYLEGLARPASVRWVDNQQQRWGSCTPSDKAIRLSSRLQGMPSWVIDYVLLHELAHLLEQGHTKAFWRMVDQLPKAERARGFLEGVACAAQLGLTPGDVPDADGEVDQGSVSSRSTPEQTVTAEVDQLT